MGPSWKREREARSSPRWSTIAVITQLSSLWPGVCRGHNRGRLGYTRLSASFTLKSLTRLLYLPFLFSQLFIFHPAQSTLSLSFSLSLYSLSLSFYSLSLSLFSSLLFFHIHDVRVSISIHLVSRFCPRRARVRNTHTHTHARALIVTFKMFVPYDPGVARRIYYRQRTFGITNARTHEPGLLCVSCLKFLLYTKRTIAGILMLIIA